MNVSLPITTGITPSNWSTFFLNFFLMKVRCLIGLITTMRRQIPGTCLCQGSQTFSGSPNAGSNRRVPLSTTSSLWRGVYVLYRGRTAPTRHVISAKAYPTISFLTSLRNYGVPRKASSPSARARRTFKVFEYLRRHLSVFRRLFCTSITWQGLLGRPCSGLWNRPSLFCRQTVCPKMRSASACERAREQPARPFPRLPNKIYSLFFLEGYITNIANL